MRSDSNVLQHFSLRHLQQIHAIPKARWGECAGKLALPFALTGAFWTPVSSESPAGVHPEAVSGSFLGVFVCWRAKRGTSPATGPDFWEATRKPEPVTPRANTNELWPSDRTPLVAAGPRVESGPASGVRKPPASTRQTRSPRPCPSSPTWRRAPFPPCRATGRGNAQPAIGPAPVAARSRRSGPTTRQPAAESAADVRRWTVVARHAAMNGTAKPAGTAAGTSRRRRAVVSGSAAWPAVAWRNRSSGPVTPAAARFGSRGQFCRATPMPAGASARGHATSVISAARRAFAGVAHAGTRSARLRSGRRHSAPFAEGQGTFRCTTSSRSASRGTTRRPT